MNKDAKLKAIEYRQHEFVNWHSAAIKFATTPPNEVTDWAQLPLFPQCQPGVSLSKTSARIPLEWRQKKDEWTRRVATYFFAQSYGTYEDSFLAAMHRSKPHAVGVAKQVGKNLLAVYWLELEVDGGVLQIATRLSVYATGAVPLQSERHIDNSQLKRALTQYTSPAKISTAIAKLFYGNGLIASFYFGILSVCTSGFTLGFINLLIELISSRPFLPRGSDGPLVLILILPCIAINFSIIAFFRVLLSRASAQEQANRSFMQGYHWNLSFTDAVSVASTSEEAMNVMSKSYDLQAFVERMNGILKEIQTYSESQD